MNTENRKLKIVGAFGFVLLGLLAVSALVFYQFNYKSVIANSIDNVNFSQYGFQNLDIKSDDATATVSFTYDRNAANNGRFLEAAPALAQILYQKSQSEEKNYSVVIQSNKGTSSSFSFDASSPSDYSDGSFEDSMKAFFQIVNLDLNTKVDYSVDIPDAIFSSDNASDQKTQSASYRVASITVANATSLSTPPDVLANRWNKMVGWIPVIDSVKNTVTVEEPNGLVRASYSTSLEKENLQKKLPVNVFPIFDAFSRQGGYYASVFGVENTEIELAADGTNNTSVFVTVPNSNQDINTMLKSLTKKDPEKLLPSGLSVKFVSEDNGIPFYTYRPSNVQW